MYIRKTTIKSRKNGEPYYTYRIVESVRTQKGVRQRTILNLGKNFSCPRDKWADITSRIEGIMLGQNSLFPLDEELEAAAQRYAAQIIQIRGQVSEKKTEKSSPSYEKVDTDSIEVLRPRSVGAEHVCYETIKQLKLEEKLRELGLNSVQLNCAIGTIIGRMVSPGSELSTYDFLQNRSALGELLDYDFNKLKLSRMYSVSDLLLKNKEALENHLYKFQRNLFSLTETITLYDLTNTYFEGSGKYNDDAKRGRSKEKRSDCPLVTLALVLDRSGFIKKTQIFPGNASEPKTFGQMVLGFDSLSTENDERDSSKRQKPTVVMDAGIAIEANITWLKENNYPYIVASRKRHRQFDENESIIVKEDKDCTVKVQRIWNEDSDEVELYCHSTRREGKDKAILDRFSNLFEQDLTKMSEGLDKKGCVKNYAKVLERIGCLKQKYSRAAKNYTVTVIKDEETENANRIEWSRKKKIAEADELPGVYCLRTNQKEWDEKTLWQTYTMLTDIESVFRCLKSEIGLRPIYHQKKARVDGHLFITTLAYQIIHTIRYQLKGHNIHTCWDGIRKQLAGQDRVTVQMECANDKILHVRKSTRPEPRQQLIYKALKLSGSPGGTIKTVIEK